MDTQKTYSIGNLSLLCSVPVKTLHYYDEIGLLVPAYRSGPGGYRYYDEKQAHTLLKIKRLKMLGFSLKEIAGLVQSDNTAELEQCVSRRLTEMEQKIALLQDHHTEGLHFLDRLRQGNSIIVSLESELADLVRADGADEEVILEDIPEVSVLFTRKMLADYQNEKVNIARWAEMLDLAETYQAVPVGAFHITYHNSVLAQFFLKECDYEVHIQVAHPRNLPVFKTYGGFRAATTYHVGGYGAIINSHLRVMRWIYANGHCVAGSVSEEFIISPLDTTDESKYLTRILIPIN